MRYATMKARNLFKITGFALIIGLIYQGPATAGQWISLGNAGFVSGDTTLDLKMPYVGQPSLSIQTDSPGDLKWISENVPLVFNEQFKATKLIDKIMICYKAPDAGTYISQIRLSQFSGPSQAIVVHDDGTDLTSPVDTCYVSKLPKYKATGAVALSLRLNIASVAHKIWIGSTMVHLK